MAMTRTYTVQIKGVEQAVTGTKTLTEAMDKQTKAVKENAKEQDALAKAEARLNSIGTEYDLQLRRANAAIKERTTEVNRQVAQENLAADSIKGMGMHLTDLRKQYDLLSAEQRDNMDIGGALLEQIQQLDEQYKALKESTGRFQDSVGNYERASTAMLKGLKGTSEAMGNFSGLMTNGSTLLGAFGVNTKSAQEALGKFQQAQTLVTAAVQVATVAQTGLNKAMLANPFTLVVAGLAAIVVYFDEIKAGITWVLEKMGILKKEAADTEKQFKEYAKAVNERYAAEYAEQQKLREKETAERKKHMQEQYEAYKAAKIKEMEVAREQATLQEKLDANTAKSFAAAMAEGEKRAAAIVAKRREEKAALDDILATVRAITEEEEEAPDDSLVVANFKTLEQKLEDLQGNLKEYAKIGVQAIAGTFATLDAGLSASVDAANEKLNGLKEDLDAATEVQKDYAKRVVDINKEIISSGGAVSAEKKEQLAQETRALEDAQIKQQKIEKEYADAQKRAADLEKQQKRNTLLSNIFMGIANTAMGVTQAIATMAPPASWVSAAITSALGLANVGIMSSQLSKLGEGGELKGKSHSQGGIKIGGGVEVEGGEFVVNKRAYSNNKELVRAINSLKGPVGGGLWLSGSRSAISGTLTGDSIYSALADINFSPQVSVVEILDKGNAVTKIREDSGW
jgi:chromosome segregation ATPase